MAAPQQHLPPHPGARDLLITTYIACANEGSRACATVAFGLSFGGGCNNNVKHFYMGSRVPNDFVQNKQVATLLATLQSLLSAPQGYDLHLILSDPGTAFLLHNIVKELKAYTRQTRQRCSSLSSKKHAQTHITPYPVRLRPDLYAHLAHAQVVKGILAEVERRLRGHDEVVVVNVGEACVRERGGLGERAHLMRATTMATLALVQDPPRREELELYIEAQLTRCWQAQATL